MDFEDGHEHEPMVRADVIGCTRRAYNALVQHINEHGDGPIPGHPIEELRFRFRTVEFGISPTTAPPLPVLSYNDTIAILLAFSLKMNREGYRKYFGAVVLNQGAGHLGDALLSNVEDESA